MYKIEYSKHVIKSLEKLPKKMKVVILEKIHELTFEPRPSGIKMLQGKLGGYYRLRVGDYRVVYSIEDKRLSILVVKVAHRGSVYDD